MDEKKFREVLEDCLQEMGVNYQATKHQEQALFNVIVEKKDTFVILPTGSGKSLIFQLIPDLVKRTTIPAKPVVILVCPLVSLMKSHQQELSKLGVSSCILGEGDDQEIMQGKFSIVMGSPEAWIKGKKWRDMLLSPIYQANAVTLVADEVHVIPKWGLNKQDEKAFRATFGKLSELRSLLPQGVNVLALTATATNEAMGKIQRLLQMRNVARIVDYPDRTNIQFVVKKVTSDILSSFQWLVDELKENGASMQRTIVYCRSVKNCGVLFKYFEREVGAHGYVPGENQSKYKSRLFAMYHHSTSETIKNHVLKSLLDVDGSVRIVFATNALGMGVNMPNVRRIIHWGPPKDVEDYVQEMGRAGRDRKPSVAVLLFNARHQAAANEHMKSYLMSTTCRRKELLKHFPEGEVMCNTSKSGSSCCDLCDPQQCDILQQIESKCEVAEHTISGLTRTVSTEDSDILRECLLQLKEENAYELSSGITDKLIDLILKEAPHIFDADYVFVNLPVMSKKVAEDITRAVSEVFDDFTFENNVAELSQDIQSLCDVTFDYEFDSSSDEDLFEL